MTGLRLSCLRFERLFDSQVASFAFRRYWHVRSSTGPLEDLSDSRNRLSIEPQLSSVVLARLSKHGFFTTQGKKTSVTRE